MSSASKRSLDSDQSEEEEEKATIAFKLTYAWNMDSIVSPSEADDAGIEGVVLALVVVLVFVLLVVVALDEEDVVVEEEEEVVLASVEEVLDEDVSVEE